MHACEAAELTEAFVHQLGVSFKRQGYSVLYQSFISHQTCFGQNFARPVGSSCRLTLIDCKECKSFANVR